MNPLGKIFSTSLSHFFCTIPFIKTNKIHTTAMTIFPLIAAAAIIGLVLYSNISALNDEKKKRDEMASKSRQKSQKKALEAREQMKRTNKLQEYEKKKTVFRETLGLITNTKNVDTVIETINNMRILRSYQSELYLTLLNHKLSIALPALKNYFETKKQSMPINEENGLINCQNNNLMCNNLKMRIEDFESSGSLNSDPNLFLPSLLLIHFFFKKICHFDENGRYTEKKDNIIETPNETSDEKVINLLTNLDYDTSELNRCIKEVYLSEKNKDGCAYQEVWTSKEQSFNDWIDRVARGVQKKSANKI